MRKSLQRVIVVVGVLAVALAVALPAQAREKTGKKVADVKERPFTGTITAMDAAAGTLTVKNQKEESKDFTCGTDCKVHIPGKESAALADLKVGEKVAVKFAEKDGKNVAEKISVAGEATKKKEKK